MIDAVTEQQVREWAEWHVRAQKTCADADIAALFTPDAEYHEWPYETASIGRDKYALIVLIAIRPLHAVRDLEPPSRAITSDPAE